MTAEKLHALPSIRREITRTKRRIAVMKRQAQSASDNHALAAAISAELALLESYIISARRAETEILEYINGIEDCEIREIFMLRYFDGIRPWQRVAFLAGEHDESYVRRKHNAYLKKN